MNDLLKKLLLKKHEKGFLANKVKLKCDSCGHTEKYTYYQLLKEELFEILEPASVPVVDGVYEEEVPATPIKFRKQCPNHDGEMESFSPVPMEYIIAILQSTQPDEIMYG
ncbi:MAG: hypothetical protein K0A89_10435 [ANME-2 cluster archaeon]|nr:hypothetical protein [ANME-2 cluster archaeon]